MIVRIDAKTWGGGGSNLSVGLTLSVLISNFDSPLTLLIFVRLTFISVEMTSKVENDHFLQFSGSKKGKVGRRK